MERHPTGWFKVMACLVLAGCGASSPDPAVDADAALRDTLGVSLEVNLHRVALGGLRDHERILPDSVQAREGDVVAFETVDGRIHRLTFDADSVAPEILDFLQETRQLESLPMLSKGDRFLVDLTDAPDGRYIFRSRTFGEPVYGVIRVGERPGG